MPKSKFFRVAVEGATSDGRAIDRAELQEMADSYNPATYAARVNMEHIRGITAEPPFQTLGDVLALKTAEIDLDIGGKTEKRLALFAEIDALEPLVAMNRKKQKIFTSVEISPNFAQTGKAYLVGLAVTDSPASLGTEMLEFCAKQGDKSPLAARKLDPANLFTAGLETEIDLAADSAANPDPTGIFASIKTFMDKMSGQSADKPGELKKEEPKVEAPATADAAAFAAFATLLSGLAETVQKLSADVVAGATLLSALRTEVDGLKTQAENTPDQTYRQRQLATGGDGSLKAEF